MRNRNTATKAPAWILKMLLTEVGLECWPKRLKIWTEVWAN